MSSSVPLFRKNLAAIGLCVFGWTAFSLTDTASKWLSQDYPVSEVIALVSIPTLLISALWIIAAHGMRGFITPHFKWHMVRGFCVAATAFCVVHSLALIPLADFYGINFLAPLLVSLLSHLLLKEKIGWHRLSAICIGFGGVIILAGPQFNTYNTGILYAFGCVLFVCANSLILRKMSGEKILPLFALYPALWNIALNAPLMIPGFKMPEAADLLLFLAVGPLLLAALMTCSMGISRASETAVVMPFNYIQMIWGVLFGYILFHDAPNATTMAGAAIIIGSGLYVIWREHRIHRLGLSAVS